MRFGWHVHLLGPFSAGGTIWQSLRRSRRKVYHGTLPGGWGGKGTCPHNHARDRPGAAGARREARLRRGLREDRRRTWRPLIRQRLWFPRWRQRLSPPGAWRKRRHPHGAE